MRLEWGYNGDIWGYDVNTYIHRRLDIKVGLPKIH